MIQTQIELTEIQMAALNALATKQQMTLTELILEAVDNLLQEAINADEARRQKAMAVAGLFHSGLGDLAVNHDNYLTEDFGT